MSRPPPPVPATLDHPIPQWIAGPPTEPEALRDLLLAPSAHLKGDWLAGRRVLYLDNVPAGGDPQNGLAGWFV